MSGVEGGCEEVDGCEERVSEGNVVEQISAKGAWGRAGAAPSGFVLVHSTLDSAVLKFGAYSDIQIKYSSYMPQSLF